MYEYTLLRLVGDDTDNQAAIDTLAKEGWAVQEVIPPAVHSGSAQSLSPALLFSRKALGVPPQR